jgi:hypothetical protein
MPETLRLVKLNQRQGFIQAMQNIGGLDVWPRVVHDHPKAAELMNLRLAHPNQAR